MAHGLPVILIMNSKYQYISESSINLDSEDEFRDLINTQGIFEDEFSEKIKTQSPSLQLKYDNDYLTQIRYVNQLNNIDIELTNSAKSFRYFKNKRNRINFLIPTEKESNSFIGEDGTAKFTTPKSNLIEVPFQIIAKISRKDKPFSWLPFEELYITYPIFSGTSEFIFLDYSEPLSPELIGNYKNIDYPFGKMDTAGIHKFNRTNLSIKSIKDLNEDEDLDFEYWYAGISGIPFWIQHPDIPKCPKTGNLMRFVCQLNTSELVKVSQSNLKSEEDYFTQYNKSLRFWGSGSLYVFMEPISKVVGFIIQDT